MDYLVLDPGFNFGKEANPLFATNDQTEAIKAARDFGQGFVVVRIDSQGTWHRIFTTPYKKDLALTE